MSFGFSIGDIIALTKLASSVVSGARQACGAHDELTREVTSLHIVLRWLERDVANPNSILVSDPGERKADLTMLVEHCKKVFGVLDGVLRKYNGLSEKRGFTRFCKSVQFGNGERLDLSRRRLELSTHTNLITMFLNLSTTRSLGKVEQHMVSHGEELKALRCSIDWGMAAMQASAGRNEGSVLSTYANDDKAFWKHLRRELVNEGYSSSVLKKHKTQIKDYAKELGDRGALDELLMDKGNQGIANDAPIEAPEGHEPDEDIMAIESTRLDTTPAHASATPNTAGKRHHLGGPVGGRDRQDTVSSGVHTGHAADHWYQDSEDDATRDEEAYFDTGSPISPAQPPLTPQSEIKSPTNVLIGKSDSCWRPRIGLENGRKILKSSAIELPHNPAHARRWVYPRPLSKRFDVSAGPGTSTANSRTASFTLPKTPVDTNECPRAREKRQALVQKTQGVLKDSCIARLEVTNQYVTNENLFSPDKGPSQQTHEARKHGIDSEYSLEDWDPSLEPITVYGSVMQATSFGEWIVDRTIKHYGHKSKIAETAVGLRSLLIEFIFTVKRAKYCLSRIKSDEYREMMEKLIESGKRLFDDMKLLVRVCEDQTRERGFTCVVEGGFLPRIFLHFMLEPNQKCFEGTEKWMASTRSWRLRFRSICDEIRKDPLENRARASRGLSSGMDFNDQNELLVS
ncbi:hypothetical protein EG329_014372 [Mollisiaceae sp. DMI_Dod_QoI]|nr:hypothetical protein EG329_014372 [Helotiales sp. DMI_Dod_QoI]